RAAPHLARHPFPPRRSSDLVVATSNADSSRSASAEVTVQAPVVAVTIDPVTAVLLEGQTQQFTATVTGASNLAVTWTADGGTVRSEEHTSELQSLRHLVCRL